MFRVLVRVIVLLLASASTAILLSAIRAPRFVDGLEEIATMGRYREFDALILDAATRYQVDPGLLKAIVWHESRFDHTKMDEGGYGLMQIGEGTGTEWAAVHGIETFMVTDLLDARTNVHVGAWYLANVLKGWADADDPAVFALAEYVAGPDAVRNWVGKSRSAEHLRSAMAGSASGAFVDRVMEWKRTR